MSAAAAVAGSSAPSSSSFSSGDGSGGSEITYVSYGGEHHLPLVMSLVDAELSEPYSIFTYRYFVYQWPQLTFLVRRLRTPPLPPRLPPLWLAGFGFSDDFDCAGVRCQGRKVRGHGGVQDGGAQGSLQGLHRHARRPQALPRQGNRWHPNSLPAWFLNCCYLFC